MKQTAVEWLIQNIVEDQTIKSKSMSEWIKVFDNAKAMEKEQIEHSYLTSYQEHTADGKHWEMGVNPKETFKQYFNETYGK